MSKFKVGDEVEIFSHEHTINKFGGETVISHIGTKSVIDCIYDDGSCVTIKADIYSYHPDDLKLVKDSSFKTSNRYKLHKYILSTGFTKQYLSLALNKNQSYLTTETRESQFTNRGDMSDARYKSLRKQIKEAVQIKSEPVDISVVGGEVNQTFLDVEPQDKKPKAFKVKDLKITIDGKELAPSLYSPFDSSPNESVSIEVTEKTSNNGAFILGLVFFVMLIIFGIGCLIYKAA